MYFKGLSAICFFIFALGQISAQENTSVAECLNFQPNTGNNILYIWQPNVDFLIMKIEPDTNVVRNGNHPLMISNKRMRDLYLLRSSMKLILPIPVHQSDSMLVKCTTKRLNIQRAYLVLTGIDKREKLLYSDTLFIHGINDWHTFTRKVSIKDAAMMHFQLDVRGIDGAKEQRIWLDKIELWIDGKNMKNMSLPVHLQDTLAAFKNIQPLSFTAPHGYDKVAVLKTKKVIAFGEFIHGSETLGKAAIQLIKYRIEHANCKLVLMELPLEQMLFVDRFVQGDERFQLEAVKQHLFGDKTLLFSPELIELCQWIKEYNKRTNEKVHLLGFDVPLSEEKMAEYIVSYLSTLNQTAKHPEIYSMCSRLQGAGAHIKNVLYTYNLNKGFKNILGERESNILKYRMESYCKALAPQIILLQRNERMWDNVEFLMKTFYSPTRTVSIYTHLVHANYISDIYQDRLEFSMGALAKKALKEDYCCIGLCAGKGDMLISDGTSLIPSVKTLLTPPYNSMESILQKKQMGYFYMPVNSFSNPIFMRHSGYAYSNKQFEIVTPGSRMDGIIYIENSKANKSDTISKKEVQ